MNKHQIVISICLGSIAIGVLVWLSSAPKAAPLSKDMAQRQSVIPRLPVVYSALFHHVAAVKEQADDAERKGKDASSLRLVFREKANLSEAQARILDAIAAECVREVAAQDARAQMIIDAFRVGFPPGKLPAGMRLPPPPPELTQMQQDRDAMILRARERLRQAFGDDEFQRFDQFVTTRVSSAMESVALPPGFREGHLEGGPGK